MSQTTTTVKRLRQAGMSQAAIAREVGVSQPTIAKWEAGKAPKAADAAIRLQLLGQGVAPPVTDASAAAAEAPHA
jgi:transcriptional regulator with XRE-family HTH domain